MRPSCNLKGARHFKLYVGFSKRNHLHLFMQRREKKLFAWIHAKIKIIDELELSKKKSDTFLKPENWKCYLFLKSKVCVGWQNYFTKWLLNRNTNFKPIVAVLKRRNSSTSRVSMGPFRLSLLLLKLKTENWKLKVL